MCRKRKAPTRHRKDGVGQVGPRQIDTLVISLHIGLCISASLFVFLAIRVAIPDILAAQTSLFIQTLAKIAVIGIINRGPIYKTYQEERVCDSVRFLSIVTRVFFSCICPRTARLRRDVIYITGYCNRMHIQETESLPISGRSCLRGFRHIVFGTTTNQKLKLGKGRRYRDRCKRGAMGNGISKGGGWFGWETGDLQSF